MTPIMRRTLAAIATYQRENGGISPACTDIAKAIGIVSKGRVSEALSALEEAGRIRRLARRARAIEIVAPIPIYDAETHALRGYLP